MMRYLLKRLDKFISVKSVGLLVFILMLVGTNVSIAQQRWKSPEVLKKELQTKFRIAQRLENQGQIERALELYKYIVNQDPKKYTYYHRYTYHLFRLKRYDELENVIKIFLEHNPRNEMAIVDLGELYFSRGDTALADEYWESALQKSNYSQSFIRSLFNGLIALQQYERAGELIQDARDYSQKDDLFAIEVAHFQMLRGNYVKSAKEYLLYGRSNSRNYRQISSQILRFPHDSSLFISLDSLIQGELQITGASRELHKLRADVLFKFKRYKEAINETMIFELMNRYRGNDILNLAVDLLNIDEFALAEETFTKIIETNQFRNIVPNALLGLADAFEKEMLSEREISPFDYFYPDNFFFIPDYVFGIDATEHQIQQAFAIYDSLIINLPRSTYTAQALYRLAELRYRVLHDLDGAIKLYQDALKVGANREIRQQCIIRLADLMIAKGDFDQVDDYIRKNIGRYEGSMIEKRLSVRLLLSDFFKNEVDSIMTNKNDLLGLLGVSDPLFNDVIEFASFIEEYRGNNGSAGITAFNDFIKSERFIRQNKLSEAHEVLAYLLINYPDQSIISPVRFRLLQIDLFFRQTKEAEHTLETLLDRGNLYADNALFMMAEIAQFRDKDPEYAAKWYEIILEQYPGSLHTDKVRKRLRELQKTSYQQQDL